MKKTWLCTVAATLLMSVVNLAYAVVIISVETDIARPETAANRNLPYTLRSLDFESDFKLWEAHWKRA